MKSVFKYSVILVCLGVEGLQSDIAGIANEIEIDPNKRYQMMSGFGATAPFIEKKIYDFPKEVREKFLDLMFSDMGARMSILYNDVQPSYEFKNFPDEEDKYQYWLMQEAKKRGVEIFYSIASSPPAKWKANKNVNGNKKDKREPNYLLEEHYSDYAKYLSDYIKGYEKVGITINVVGLQNEPDFNADYPSCLWTKEQLSEFAKVVKKLFVSSKVKAKISFPDTVGWKTAIEYTAFAFKDTEAVNAVDIIGAHTFGGGDQARLFELAAKYNKTVWQTSSADLRGSDESMVDGLRWAKEITEDLTYGNVSAWIYWWLVAFSRRPCANALTRYNGQDNILVIPKRFWVFSQFSRFIRGGAVRIESADFISDLKTCAFLDSNKTTIILVVVNDANKEEKFEISVAGHAVEKIRGFRTTETEDMAELKIMSDRSPVIPPKSVATYLIDIKSNTMF
ncbi:MAG: hypothetical protein HY606_01255 [Planctomycetes bacterium]|nr:hypothetical protein [Planctomycetota bacterium]